MFYIWAAESMLYLGFTITMVKTVVFVIIICHIAIA